MRWKNSMGLRVGPAGFAARLAQLVLKVGNRLFVRRHDRGPVLNFRFGFGQVLPTELFPHGHVRIAVILLLFQAVFTLQDVELAGIVRQFLSSIGKSFSPIVLTLGLSLIDRCRRFTLVGGFVLVRCPRLIGWRGWRFANNGDRSLDGVEVVVCKYWDRL